jgi:hypothetical protein
MGGMCGDLILGMIDPDTLYLPRIGKRFYYLATIGQYQVRIGRTMQKNFWKYSEERKWRYHEKYNSFNRTMYTLSHDTDFCSKIPSAIQLYCGDTDRLIMFAERFKYINRERVIDIVCRDLNLNKENFVEEYAQCLHNWQSAFVFENRFDISNVGKDCFVDDVLDYFEVKDEKHARALYKDWKDNPKNPQKDSDFFNFIIDQ